MIEANNPSVSKKARSVASLSRNASVVRRTVCSLLSCIVLHSVSDPSNTMVMAVMSASRKSGE